MYIFTQNREKYSFHFPHDMPSTFVLLLVHVEWHKYCATTCFDNNNSNNNNIMMSESKGKRYDVVSVETETDGEFALQPTHTYTPTHSAKWHKSHTQNMKFMQIEAKNTTDSRIGYGITSLSKLSSNEKIFRLEVYPHLRSV